MGGFQSALGRYWNWNSCLMTEVCMKTSRRFLRANNSRRLSPRQRLRLLLALLHDSSHSSRDAWRQYWLKIDTQSQSQPQQHNINNNYNNSYYYYPLIACNNIAAGDCSILIEAAATTSRTRSQSNRVNQQQHEHVSSTLVENHFSSHDHKLTATRTSKLASIS